MDTLTERKKFYDTGNINRNRENFQGFIFDRIIGANKDQPISFVRSDFRGTLIRNSNFSGNNFSRADFISSTIESTIFHNCTFRSSEFYNCSLSQVSFSENLFKSISWNRLLFSECTIEKNILQDITLRDCSFYRCQIKNSKLRQNSFDEARFENCSLENLDLSNMTAINLYFTDCAFKNLTIEADYLGSYFFKGNHFGDVDFKYRGKVFKAQMKKIELLVNLFKLLIETKRYYEAINILIHKNLLHQQSDSIMPLVLMIIEELLKETNVLQRDYQLEKIFQVFAFYFNSPYVLIDDYFEFIELFDETDLSSLELNTQVMILGGIQRLKNLFQLTDLSIPFITSTNFENILLEITVEDQNEPFILPAFENFLLALQPINKAATVYHVINKRKGSVIYDIAIHATIGLLVLKILKAMLKQLRVICNEGVQILIDFSVNRKLLAEANKSKTLTKLNEIKNLQVLSKQVIDEKNPEIASKVEGLLSLCESIKCFPNGLSQSNK